MPRFLTLASPARAERASFEGGNADAHFARRFTRSGLFRDALSGLRPAQESDMGNNQNQGNQNQGQGGMGQGGPGQGQGGQGQGNQDPGRGGQGQQGNQDQGRGGQGQQGGHDQGSGSGQQDDQRR